MALQTSMFPWLQLHCKRETMSACERHVQSSCNDISADHDRAQWGEVRRRQNNIHHKNCIKTDEAKWPLEFTGGKYNCAGKDQQQL
jgi:hypothetical protein